MGRRLILATFLLFVGCDSAQKAKSEDSPPVAPSLIGVNPVLPESTLSYFLSVTVPTRQPNTVMLDSIYGCSDTENLDHVLWLADWHMDSSTALGDSMLVYFRATSVARLRAANGGYRAVMGIEEIPIVARLDRVGQRWTVCVNFRDWRHPADDFFIGGPFPNIRWQPAGANIQQVFAAIDSIRRARGLAIIR
jgi:hypothetical protein